MIHSRKEREKLEDQTLAPYACRSAKTRGRLYNEQAHAYRTEFQRDRDRVIHSRSFRRLEYKTQVFVNGTADHYRTRLTHTFEMAAVGRTIARALRANEELTETIALAHDIGHSPFGHCGERALDELMADHGGFDHNIQSLRWVELLEQRYPQFGGLNLTWEVRSGLRKHLASQTGAHLDGHAIGPHQFVEAQIADVADDITYHAHDVDDGIDADLILVDELQQLELWRAAERRVDTEYTAVEGAQKNILTVRYILDLQVEDVVHTSIAKLEELQPSTPDDVMHAPENLVTFSPEMKSMLEPYRTYLSDNLYYHPAVADANEEAVQMMRRLFMYYIEHPDSMGRKARARIDKDGLWRTACDYISGMTDRYAIEEYMRFGLDKTSLVDQNSAR